MEKTSITDLLNVEDFKKLYFNDSNDSFCDIWSSLSYNKDKGFLEIANLDVLRAKHKIDTISKKARHKFYSLTLLTAGKITMNIGSAKYEFEKNTLFFIPENQIYNMEYWSEDVKGVFCMFDTDYFLLASKQIIKLSQFPFYQLDNKPYIKLSDDCTRNMDQFLEKLQHEKCNKQTENDDMLTRMFLNIILLEAERLYTSESNEKNVSLTRKGELIANFQSLVNQHFMTHRQVSEYAEMLYIHPNYLNDLAKEIVGVTASSIIQNRLIQEAKARLLQTSDTIYEIALSLNFREESYFSRFFKKHTGDTPSQFRKDFLNQVSTSCCNK